MDPFAGRRLSTLTKSDLDGLIQRGVSESMYLDYKREIGLGSDENRKEFLKDVTAFANSGGGVLVYGIDELRDSAGKPTGLPGSLGGVECGNVGQLKSVIDHLIRDGIDEPLYGSPEIAFVDVGGGKHTILVRVPASLRAPHMVKFKGDNRFYRRVNTGSERMTASQVRDSALQSSAAEVRVAELLGARRTVLRRRMPNKPFTILHLMPLVSDPRQLDVTLESNIRRMQQVGESFGPYDGGRLRQWRGSHRLEGYQLDEAVGGSSFESWDGIWNRILFHRNGLMEFVDAYTVRPAGGLYHYYVVEPAIHTALRAGMSMYDDQMMPLPVAVSISLENISGLAWPEIDRLRQRIEKGRALPDGNITPEPVLITELAGDYTPAMKPLWDFVWNTAGQPRCTGYDDNGQFRGYSRS
jgi:hypothetical protein